MKTGGELRMIGKIADYDMDYIILYLGSNVNILTIHTWDNMNNPRLDWFPIQLRLANQSKVLPIGILTQVHVEDEGLIKYANFKVSICS